MGIKEAEEKSKEIDKAVEGLLKELKEADWGIPKVITAEFDN